MNAFQDDKADKRIDDISIREEEELVESLAINTYNIPYVNLANQTIEMDALRFVNEEDAKRANCAPFKAAGRHISLAIISPQNEYLLQTIDDLKRKDLIPEVYMASHASLARVWERYAELSHATLSREGGIDISSQTLTKLGSEIKTISDVSEQIKQILSSDDIHTTSRILETILAGALSIDASDVHIEPEENFIRLRYRLDGVLQEIMQIPTEKYHLINSRIKLISGMKLSSTTNAQDGRFSIFIKDEEIGIRTSVIPSAYGEGIVMRILNPKTTQVKFEDLGIEKKLFSIVQQEINKPHGMILISGPTGSGKTTTLYSFLRQLNSTEKKIITVEDPIEYHLPGITQTQVDEQHGYTFAESIRSAMRQDPEICMVGEIRDKESASIAINFALTGHMVFSTVHTNSAAGIIPRLIDLGANPNILVSALSVGIAQRLVRKVCPVCKTERAPSIHEKEAIKKILEKAVSLNKYIYDIDINSEYKIPQAVGCAECNMTGYKGRIGVFEAILTDDAIAKLIVSEPSERDVEKVAETQGILNMREDGIIKILQGITTYEEVASVVDMVSI
ncbi:MAG: GspE/PulE family protein [Minisyncoccia bacterium]